MNILLISSRPPHHSAGLGQSIMDGLTDQGCRVDFLTKFSYDGQPDNVISLLKKPKDSFLRIFKRKILNIQPLGNFIRSTLSLFLKMNNSPYIINNGISIKYPNEATPDIPSELLLKKIRNTYDAVITLFWQDMINTTSLKKIYDKLSCPILIFSPDMSPMTGGCFYFDKCNRFSLECGYCPGFNSHEFEDQSHHNYLIKKNNYENMICAFLGNSWMNKFAKQSKLFSHIIKTEIVINEKKFISGDKELSRKKIGIDPKYNFVLMLRSDNHPRKGNVDLFKALSIFLSGLTASEKSGCCVLVVGDKYFESISQSLECYIHNIGMVEEETLISCYQASNYFLNASHDDAGPSMINQSIMCGTPVICYNNGAAIDVVEQGKSGFKVDTGDIEGLAKSIQLGHRLDNESFSELRRTTRQLGLEHNSLEKISKNIINAINSLKKS